MYPHLPYVSSQLICSRFLTSNLYIHTFLTSHQARPRGKGGGLQVLSGNHTFQAPVHHPRYRTLSSPPHEPWGTLMHCGASPFKRAAGEENCGLKGPFNSNFEWFSTCMCASACVCRMGCGWTSFNDSLRTTFSVEQWAMPMGAKFFVMDHEPNMFSCS